MITGRWRKKRLQEKQWGVVQEPRPPRAVQALPLTGGGRLEGAGKRPQVFELELQGFSLATTWLGDLGQAVYIHRRKLNFPLYKRGLVITLTS